MFIISTSMMLHNMHYVFKPQNNKLLYIAVYQCLEELTALVYSSLLPPFIFTCKKIHCLSQDGYTNSFNISMGGAMVVTQVGQQICQSLLICIVWGLVVYRRKIKNVFRFQFNSQEVIGHCIFGKINIYCLYLLKIVFTWIK